MEIDGAIRDTVLRWLDREINVRYVSSGRVHKYFVVEEGYVGAGSFSDYLKVHVSGYFPFSEDLRLDVVADGVLDCKETQMNRDMNMWGAGDYNTFLGYDLSATVRNSSGKYIAALEKIVFPWDEEFKDGKLDVDYGSDYEMFTMIRLLGMVGVVEHLVDLGFENEIEKTHKELEAKIEGLGFNKYPVEYLDRYGISRNDQGMSRWVPFVKARHIAGDTGVGFEVTYYPITGPDTERTYFCVTLPHDVPKDLIRRYGLVCDVPNIDGMDYVDRVFFESPNYSVTDRDVTKCVIKDEETFLRSFRGWDALIRRLKHGKPKELEMNDF